MKISRKNLEEIVSIALAREYLRIDSNSDSVLNELINFATNIAEEKIGLIVNKCEIEIELNGAELLNWKVNIKPIIEIISINEEGNIVDRLNFKIQCEEKINSLQPQKINPEKIYKVKLLCGKEIDSKVRIIILQHIAYIYDNRSDVMMNGAISGGIEAIYNKLKEPKL